MEHQTNIEITVNGEARRVTAGVTVADVLDALGLTPERVAVELNLSILPRAAWPATRLASGDRLEVVHFVGGG
ncbi:MAG TPA: sulfur carrier protein ThiS [Blastocatellia bacterium]|nr:sulfur carrier protein ThiS [Blastocatellia bacterium]